MKGIISTILATILLVSWPLISSDAKTQNSEINSENYNENVYFTTEKELLDVDDNSELKAFMTVGGIIVVEELSNESDQLISQKLNFAVYSDDIQSSESSNTIHVASLYYMYPNGTSGSLSINRGLNDSTPTENLINDAITEVKNSQEYEVANITNTDSAELLHIARVTTTAPPKGKLTATYQIFTVQDFFELDFYVVKASVTATPGAVLAEDSSQYEKKYQLENMCATIESPTNSVTIDSHGPYSTENSTSYTVDVGLSVDTDKTIQISGGWSYSRNINDVNIEAYRTSDKAGWDIGLEWNSSVQKKSFTFDPAVSFVCPYNKSTIDIEVYASCIFDSFFSFEETFELSKTFHCTPTSVTES